MTDNSPDMGADPVAWADFAASGNVRFWTADQYRALRETEAGRAMQPLYTVDALRSASNSGADLQSRVQPWMMTCFGPEISADTTERNHRFLEEALELVQSTSCTRDEAHQLVDYVFDRPVGDRHQEVGGVMITLAALCLATGDDMHKAGEDELTRIWAKVEAIRAKQAAKPKHSPLPQHIPLPAPGAPASPWPDGLDIGAAEATLSEVLGAYFYVMPADGMRRVIAAALRPPHSSRQQGHLT